MTTANDSVLVEEKPGGKASCHAYVQRLEQAPASRRM